MTPSKYQNIKLLQDAGIILRKGPNYPDGFKLKSGKISDVYINMRDLIKSPTTLNFMMHDLYLLNYDSNYHKPGACVLGIPTMGAVFAPIFAYKTGIPLAVIRQNKKDHGVGNTIEGTLTNRIIIIDDVITTGLSINEALDQFVKPKFGSDYTLDVYVLVDRQEHQLENVHSILTLSEIEEWKPLEADNTYEYQAWVKKGKENISK